MKWSQYNQYPPALIANTINTTETPINSKATAKLESAWRPRNPPHRSEALCRSGWCWKSYLSSWSLVVAASYCGNVFHKQWLGNWSELKENTWKKQNIEHYFRGILWSLLDILDWARVHAGQWHWTLYWCSSLLVKKNQLNVLEITSQNADLSPTDDL